MELSVSTAVEALTDTEIQGRLMGPHMTPGDYVCCAVYRSSDSEDRVTAGTDTAADLGLETAAALGIARGHGGDLQMLRQGGRPVDVRVWLPPLTDDVN